MRKLTLSIAVATLATAGVAIAAPGMMQGDMTRAQVQATAAEHFAKMDANGDGKLDAADREARRAKMFDRIDTDKDGAISRDEFTAHHRAGPGGEHAMHEGQRGEQVARDGHRGMRGHRGGGMHMMKRADTDGDGASSQAECTAGALTMFDAADADRNGTVTQAERKAAHDAMRAQWKAKREAGQAD